MFFRGKRGRAFHVVLAAIALHSIPQTIFGQFSPPDFKDPSQRPETEILKEKNAVESLVDADKLYIRATSEKERGQAMLIWQDLAKITPTENSPTLNLVIIRSALNCGNFQAAKNALVSSGDIRSNSVAFQNEGLTTLKSRPAEAESVVPLGEPFANGYFAVAGSGTIVSKDGWVLTAAHVIAHLENPTVLCADGSKVKVERIYPGGFRADLALVKVSKTFSSCTPIAKIPPVEGEKVCSMGFPKGCLVPVKSEGVMMGSRQLMGLNGMESTLFCLEGSSGSGVLNNKGEIVGVITHKPITRNDQKEIASLSFMMPLKEIEDLVSDSKSKESFPVSDKEDWGERSVFWSDGSSREDLFSKGLVLIYSDHDKAISYIKKAYDNGNMRAAYLLAQYSLFKLNRQKKDEELAYSYFSEASDSIPGALFQRGKMKIKGLGSEIDIAGGIKDLEEASKEGCGEADAFLAYLYLNNSDVPFNFKKGMSYAEKSSAAMIPFGMISKIFGMFLELLSPENPKPWNDVVQKLKSPSFNEGLFPPKKAQSFFEFCQFAVQHKAPTANFYLGCCYEEGTGTEKDIIQAISCFEQDAQEGGSQSPSALGKIYYGGKDVPQDLEKSMFWFEKGALSGDPTCMMMYLCSEMKKDPKQHLSPKSIAFVKKAADLHFAQAQHMCGLLYKEGTSVPKDTEKAVDYFEASVGNNFSESALELGILYRSGKDVPKDVEKSMFWFEKGALLGDPKCMAAYACAEYEKDPQNTSSSPLSIKSIGFLQKAAEQGNAQAQSILGACYLEGGGVTRNENEGAKWLTKAAEQGLSGAQLPLGVCYFNGVGVSKDAKEAVRWFTKAAEQGSPEAELNLAKCYSQGTGTDANQIEANKWFAKAAEHGNPLAQCTLGARYSSGNGVTKDNKEAARLFAKAAEQGMPEAQFFLAGCYFSGLGVARNEEEAIKLLVKAAKSNYPLAQYNLGSCYYKGTGIAKDLKKAVYYLEAAQKNGCQEDNNLLKAAQTELEKDK